MTPAYPKAFPMTSRMSNPRVSPSERSRFWSYVLVAVVGILLGMMFQQCSELHEPASGKGRID
jgi:hypothetical protein